MKMLKDIVSVFYNWRIVHLLGVSTLRSRYSRSKFGQTWLSITMFVQILCIGLIWSLIWRMGVDDYLPYVGVGHIIYLFYTQTINESTGIFVADARVYLNDRQPFMLSVGAHIYRNVLILLHNIPTIFLLVIWSSSANFEFSFMFVISLSLSLFFVLFASYFCAVISTRFRDLIQLIGLLMQLAFFVSPVMWKVSFLPEQYQNYVYINPFASLLELIRNPIIGIDVNPLAFVSLVAWTFIIGMVSYFSYKVLDKKVIFWV
ncbi:ABC-2 type transporter family protein [Vibrio cholerae HC-70A1]|nr:ABC-2 type transporter family protein [Vibrio cholerae HC-70A1]EGS53371.1 ABC-2 type transporter family protein [Vibrio cholerae HC-48A1]EGS53546.1 ABC-2 type transporter family protein [Vibrio cholerae HC-40A1]EHH88728.1 ABC-2 type transporter family protein [Vibrio cholerae HC-22A1]EHH96912.1 ABC-2 type transporter family protein [Vibrio cholerae HC-32A1]EJH45612.1 ABC-2 type transporter family protein [Vibrio cholerae CP1042(15)]EJH77722.1 ABC-2 type transporter family protein [Vibrio c